VAVAIEVTYLNFLRAFWFRTTTSDTTHVSSNNWHAADQILDDIDDATRWHILKLKCTKFDFGWGFRPHWGNLQGKGKREEGEGRERWRGEGKGKGRRGPCTNISR